MFSSQEVMSSAERGHISARTIADERVQGQEKELTKVINQLSDLESYSNNDLSVDFDSIDNEMNRQLTQEMDKEKNFEFKKKSINTLEF